MAKFEEGKAPYDKREWLEDEERKQPGSRKKHKVAVDYRLDKLGLKGENGRKLFAFLSEKKNGEWEPIVDSADNEPYPYQLSCAYGQLGIPVPAWHK